MQQDRKKTHIKTHSGVFPTCYYVHAVSFSALFNDVILWFELRYRQEIHHHRNLLIVKAAQEIILLDGFDDQTCLADDGR